jgi:hypothetical protein
MPTVLPAITIGARCYSSQVQVSSKYCFQHCSAIFGRQLLHFAEEMEEAFMEASLLVVRGLSESSGSSIQSTRKAVVAYCFRLLWPGGQFLCNFAILMHFTFWCNMFGKSAKIYKVEYRLV